MNRKPFTTVYDDNSITLPDHLSAKLGIKPGDKLDLDVCGDCLTIRRAPSREDLEKWALEIVSAFGDEIDRVSVRDRSVYVRSEDDGEIANCHPDDDYSFIIGVAVALCKLKLAPLPYGLRNR